MVVANVNAIATNAWLVDNNMHTVLIVCVQHLTMKPQLLENLLIS